MNHLRRYFDSWEGDVGLPLYAQSSGHSQTDVRAGLWNVQSLLSSLLILRSGCCCASPRALSSSVSSVQLALNCRPHKDHTNMLCTNSHLQRLVLVYLVFSLLKRNLWHSSKLPVRRLNSSSTWSLRIDHLSWNSRHTCELKDWIKAPTNLR